MEFIPERMIGHKLRMVHNSIDKFFDRRGNGETKKVPRGQVMIIHYLSDDSKEENPHYIEVYWRYRWQLKQQNQSQP